MSEYNVEQSGQRELNSLNPTAVGALTAGAGNVRIGQQTATEVGAEVYGFVSLSSPLQTFGAISESLATLDGEELTDILVTGNQLKVNYGGNQPLVAISLDVKIGELDVIVCSWDAGQTMFVAVPVVGLDDFMKTAIGATTKLSITES